MEFLADRLFSFSSLKMFLHGLEVKEGGMTRWSTRDLGAVRLFCMIRWPLNHVDLTCVDPLIHGFFKNKYSGPLYMWAPYPQPDADWIYSVLREKHLPIRNAGFLDPSVSRGQLQAWVYMVWVSVGGLGTDPHRYQDHVIADTCHYVFVKTRRMHNTKWPLM